MFVCDCCVIFLRLLTAVALLMQPLLQQFWQSPAVDDSAGLLVVRCLLAGVPGSTVRSSSVRESTMLRIDTSSSASMTFRGPPEVILQEAHAGPLPHTYPFDLQVLWADSS
jgi:hypothetical protein